MDELIGKTLGQYQIEARIGRGGMARVWRDGEPPAGVHNALLDNQNGLIEALGNDIYRLTADISEAAGVRNRGGEYNWTVVLVQIEPAYQDLGVQAEPARFRFEPPGGGSSDGGFDGGGLEGGN